jgi:hypothetical protein
MRTVTKPHRRHVWAAALLACLAAATPTLAGLGERADEPQWTPLPSPPPSSEVRVPGMAEVRDQPIGLWPLPSVRVRPSGDVPAVKPKAASVRPVPRVDGSMGSARGLASYYCRAGVSICTHGYPPGSMVAAACGKLRAAMGSHWRGRVVTVRAGSRSVRITLVDWCGSTSKLIDLYWEPMRRLGGTGVLPVVVSWR